MALASSLPTGKRKPIFQYLRYIHHHLPSFWMAPSFKRRLLRIRRLSVFNSRKQFDNPSSCFSKLLTACFLRHTYLIETESRFACQEGLNMFEQK